jgi:hypothetical protein
VGPLPSAIHGGGQLSPHPCGSAHSARPAFSLHPSRDLCRLDFLRRRSKAKQSNSFPAEAGPTRDTAGPTGCPRCFLVGPALAGKRPVWALAVLQTRLPPVGASLLAKALVHPPNSWCLKHSIREQARLPQGWRPTADFQPAFMLGGVTRSVRGCIPTRSVGTIECQRLDGPLPG